MKKYSLRLCSVRINFNQARQKKFLLYIYTVKFIWSAIMPVIIEYVVEREGMEKAIFASKTEADAYDKLLDTADNLVQLLTKSALLKESQIQELAIYLAKNRDSLITALAHKRKPTTNKATQDSSTDKKDKKVKLAPQSLLDIVIEPDDEASVSNTGETIDQSSEAAA